jgi:hypothetical protein
MTTEHDSSYEILTVTDKNIDIFSGVVADRYTQN